jgi:two-component system, chemotaxis family, sensor kinase CheA
MTTDAEALRVIAAEAADHVTAGEAILIAAVHATPERAEVDRLFRAFHSLKGLARAAAAEQFEALLHDAETWLADLRSGRREFDAQAGESLLQLLDLIRDACASGAFTDAAAPPALSARLRALLDAPMTNADTHSASLAIDVLGIEVETSAAFAELLAEILPELAAAVASGVEIEDDVAVLHHAAKRLGLLGFASRLVRLRGAAEGERAGLFEAVLRSAASFGFLTGATTGRLEAQRRPGSEPAQPPQLPQETPETRELRSLFAQLKINEMFVGELGGNALAFELAADNGLVIVEAVVPLPDPDELVRLVSTQRVLAGRGVGGARRDHLALLLVAPAKRLLEDLASEIGADHCQKLDGQTPPRHFAKPTEHVPTGAAQDALVRVPVEVLDRLFGRIGSFFSVGARLGVLATESGANEALRRLSDFAVTRAPEIMPEIEALLRDRRDFLNVEAEVGRLISLIHESTLGLRVIPFDNVVARFPRMVREMARQLGKSVHFELVSGPIKIDKGMADTLIDPITHIVRNALDHGVETPAERGALGKPASARVTLRAEQLGNRLVVTIEDDGRGIAIDKVAAKALTQRLVSEADIARMTQAQIARLIFTPGFSTRDQASELSGRGVGMDVALFNVTRLGGTIHIDNRPGLGAAFRLDMPLSAAIRPLLLVDTGTQTIGLPEAIVAEALIVPGSSVQSVNGQPSLLLRERYLPIFDLCDLLALPRHKLDNGEDISVVVCRWNGQRAALRVHRILRRLEMLIRETHPRITSLPGIGGVSTLGADRIVLVLDPDKLFGLASRFASRGLRSVGHALKAADGAQ